jgi:hypothetical protein
MKKTQIIRHKKYIKQCNWYKNGAFFSLKFNILFVFEKLIVFQRIFWIRILIQIQSWIRTRVETKMQFSFFAKMRKSCDNGTIFANFANFREFRQFLFLRKFKIFAIISQNFRENFHENEKSLKYDSDTACMVHVV